MGLLNNKKIQTNVQKWNNNYFIKLRLNNLTNDEKLKVKEILNEVGSPFNIDNVESMPKLYATTGESISELTRLWLITRQNWMIIDQLSKLNQTMSELLEMEKGYEEDIQNAKQSKGK